MIISKLNTEYDNTGKDYRYIFVYQIYFYAYSAQNCHIARGKNIMHQAALFKILLSFQSSNVKGG